MDPLYSSSLIAEKDFPLSFSLKVSLVEITGIQVPSCVPPIAISPRDCACAFDNGIDILVGKQLSARNNKSCLFFL